MLDVSAEPTPIVFDDSGTARISGTRVTLESVLWTFNEGASAEEIAARFPSLPLADVYAVLTYYLRHRDAVNSYLREADAAESAVITRLVPSSAQDGLRARLLKRQDADSE